MGERYTDYLPLAEIKRAARNPKGHDADGIRASIGQFGLVEQPQLDERTGRLVAGHGRLDQLDKLHADGQDPPDGVRVGPGGEWLVPVTRGWSSRSDAEAEAYLLASNRLTETGGWDDRGLAEMLEELADQQLLEVTGFGDTDLADLLASFTEGESDADTPGGDLLELAGVTLAEPTHQVTTGQVWELGEHHLVVADVFDGWPAWVPLLHEGSMFMPYPTMLAPFGRRAEGRRLVMVQPETYLAGHLLDKWAHITGQQPHLTNPDSP